MRIGVVVQSSIKLGGAHNYENQFVNLMKSTSASMGHEVVVFAHAGQGSKVHDVNAVSFRVSRLRFALAHARSNSLVAELLRILGLGLAQLERKAIKQNIELLVFASPNHLSPGIRRIPIATTAWDFGHLDLPHGSETSLGGLWQWREELYATTAARSIAMFCDSKSTKSRLVSRYGCDPNRIYKVGLLPMVPDEILPIKFDRPHLIYPAMFWPHKNHEVLLKAFKRFLDRTPDSAYLVFTGDGAMRSKVESIAVSLGVRAAVKFEGLVERGRLFGLIAGSRGLLMPSLLGPSNLPQLEASLMGVPVAISDCHDMDDLLAGQIVVSAQSSEAWSAVMEEMITSDVPPARVSYLGSEDLIRDFILSAELQTAPWR